MGVVVHKQFLPGSDGEFPPIAEPQGSEKMKDKVL